MKPNDASSSVDANRAIANKYDTLAYAARANAQSHPDRLATVARLLGIAAPAVESARVLEVGCSDGANLLPMAADLPQATFTGCDISPRAIAKARDGAAALGLANVTFVERDLATLAHDADLRLHHRARRVFVGARRQYAMRCSRSRAPGCRATASSS